MKPFVLKQHDKDFAAYRELRDEEMKDVSGGERNNRPDIKMNTMTVTPSGDGGDDGADEG